MLSRDEFESLVADGVKALPEHIRQDMDNVEIVIEDSAGNDHLLGHYRGVPLPNRGSGYGGVLPDKITIYRRPIERRARTADELAEQVRITVWHEIAHHFGIDDDRLKELGLY